MRTLRLVAEMPEAAKESSPQLLTTLGVLLKHAGGNPEPLLRAALRRRPGDFWLNCELGRLLVYAKPAEAAGFFRAALAVRPGNELMLGSWGESHQRRPMLEAVKRAKIKPTISFHGLRHTWASLG